MRPLNICFHLPHQSLLLTSLPCWPPARQTELGFFQRWFAFFCLGNFQYAVPSACSSSLIWRCFRFSLNDTLLWDVFSGTVSFLFYATCISQYQHLGHLLGIAYLTLSLPSRLCTSRGCVCLILLRFLFVANGKKATQTHLN